MDMPIEDLSLINMLDCTPDPEFDDMAYAVRSRFGVDAALVTIIDSERDRQVFKGRCAPHQTWAEARSTPLSHSLCNYVASQSAPLCVRDARIDPRTRTNLAPVDLAVVGYLAAPIFANTDTPVGALCLVTNTPRDWTDTERSDLQLFARSISHSIDMRFVAVAEERAQAEIDTLKATQKEAAHVFRSVTDNLPGAAFRYAMFDDGTDAIEYISESCLDIWGYDEDELRGDPSLLWAAILDEDREAAFHSVQRSARDMSPWRRIFTIRRKDGSLHKLQAYAAPQPIAGGVGVLWHTLMLDLTKMEQDALNQTSGSPLQ